MFKKRLLIGLILLTLLLIALAGCAQPPAEGVQPATSIVLPEGDPEAGRRAMSSLGCALCHFAAGDQGMPRPTSTTVGPVLGPDQKNQSTDMLVESILNPSHRLPEELAEDGISPMLDYQDITVRQLSDLVAYIRYLGE